jgi:hypothetical protein
MYIEVEYFVCSKEFHQGVLSRGKGTEFVYIERASNRSASLRAAIFADQAISRNGVGEQNVCIDQRSAGFLPRIGTLIACAL